jgi:hypothetical protein
MDAKKYMDIVNFLASDRCKRHWPNEIILEENQKKKNDMKAVFRSSLKRRYVFIYILKNFS